MLNIFLIEYLIYLLEVHLNKKNMCKKNVLLVIIALLLSLCVKSQTYIMHESNVSGKWIKERSPYIIQGLAKIPIGQTLEIESGVEIKLNTSEDDRYSNKDMRGSLLVEGTLIAVGASTSPIVFTGVTFKDGWGSLYFKNSNGSKLIYCNFNQSKGIYSLAGRNKDGWGAITVENCSPKLDHIEIKDSRIGIFVTTKGFPEINNSSITHCVHAAIYCIQESTPRVRNTSLSHSGFGLRCESSNPIIENCNIIHNIKYGLVVNDGSQPQINSSILWGNPFLFENFESIYINNSIIQPAIDRENKFLKQISTLQTNNIIGVPNNFPNLTNEISNNYNLLVSINHNNVNKQIGIHSTNSNNSDVVIKTNNVKAYENRTELGNINSIASDVDLNIPFNKNKNDYKFALVIGNEDYTRYQTNLTSEVNVDFAIHDAEIFAKYCKNTLGVPEENIFLLKNAIGTEIKRGVNKISKMMLYTQGKAEVIFYYAGHGIPHETSKESYLMPVDVSAQNIEDGVKLSWLYSKLTEYNAKYVLVFLDACFTGGARNQGLLAARGVKIKPKDDIINGNCVVFTSSSDIQSSLPYKDKQHGMFTYFLLKKLQESNGNITLEELSNYLYENVALNSIRVNSKEQTPKTLVSPAIKENWKLIKLNE